MLQQLARVGRNNTAGENIKVLMLTRRHDSIVQRIGVVGKVTRQAAFVRQREIVRQHRLADIQPDKCHFLTQNSEREGCIGSDIGLTLTVDTGGNEQHDAVGAIGRQHKIDIRTQRTEHLCRHGVLALTNGDMHITGVVHNNTQKRRTDMLLKLLRVGNFIIEEADKIQNARRESKPQHKADKRHHFETGLCR